MTRVWNPPLTERYRERVRQSARLQVERAAQRLAAEQAAAERTVRQLHDHPVAVALRAAHGDAAERVPQSEGPHDDPALTLALQVSRSGDRAVVRAQLRRVRAAVGDLPLIPLVTAFVFDQERVPLSWTQARLPV